MILLTLSNKSLNTASACGIQCVHSPKNVRLRATAWSASFHKTNTLSASQARGWHGLLGQSLHPWQKFLQIRSAHTNELFERFVISAHQLHSARLYRTSALHFSLLRPSGKVDAKRDLHLPGACRAAATPLALDLAPRGSARPGRRQDHFRYTEGCQGPLPPPHCKLMRDRLEASIRRPLWRFGVARATAMT